MEIIEPHPLLIEYVKKSNALWTEFDNFSQNSDTDKQEWHYIMSNLEQNIFLLRRLNELNLLSNEINICDAGIGLGSALFDLYLQSKEINKNFKFFGIEKQYKYIEYLKNNLINYWNDELTLIESDIMNCDFSKYNIIYSYSPYRSPRTLLDFYNKLKNEIVSGSLIIENRENGLGLDQTLLMVEGLEKIELDDIFIFKKI